MTSRPTDALLLKASLLAGYSSSLHALLKRFQSALAHMSTHEQIAVSVDQTTLYMYLHFERRTAIELDWLQALEASLLTDNTNNKNITTARISRLEKVFAPACASGGEVPAFHYVVEMDPADGHMPELSQWYDTEHMPGLAQVSGCVQATRFLNHDHGPLSLACYDLVSQETLGSLPWLAVRHTDWSSRMRTHFTNTIRTMFKPVTLDAYAKT